MKQCSKCETEYPATVEFFMPQKDRKSGLSSWCRVCRREHARNYAVGYRVENPSYAKAYRESHKLEIKTYQGIYNESHESEKKEYGKIYKESHKSEAKVCQEAYRETVAGRTTMLMGNIKSRCYTPAMRNVG